MNEKKYVKNNFINILKNCIEKQSNYDYNNFSKIYHNGNLEFEGYYINGKRIGKGKQYDYYGHVIFEGEYLDGKRWNGKGNYGDNNFYEFKNGKG